MRNFLLGLSFALVFIAGCVASQFIVPPVRAGTNPVKWEYMCLGKADWWVKDLNKAGAQGWEMVAAKDTCFKRPLP